MGGAYFPLAFLGIGLAEIRHTSDNGTGFLSFMQLCGLSNCSLVVGEEMPFLEKCQHKVGVCAAASALNARGFVLEKAEFLCDSDPSTSMLGLLFHLPTGPGHFYSLWNEYVAHIWANILC